MDGSADLLAAIGVGLTILIAGAGIWLGLYRLTRKRSARIPPRARHPARSRQPEAGAGAGVAKSTGAGIKEWVTVADFGGDPCPICAPMDKKQIPLSERFWVEGLNKWVDHPGPTEVHPDCRCGLLIYEEKDSG